MITINYKLLLSRIKGQTVTRPNASTSGTLSGHAAGEPFEKLVYNELKKMCPNNIFKQYEYLNDLYRTHPKAISLEDKKAQFDSPVALFLLNRSESATRLWNPQNIFEEKQNDTADILFHNNGFFEIIDVKTRNMAKPAMAPNIISAYKVAQMCTLIIDNEEYDTIDIKYIEVDWKESGTEKLICENTYIGELFKANPNTLYINWAAAMQIQFHVSELDQSFKGNLKEWAKEYLKMFVKSAEHRIDIMHQKYVAPFKKYIEE